MITLNEAPSSPIVSRLFDRDISLLNAIEIRNQLNNVIYEHQKHFLKQHISNAGRVKEKQ